VKVLDYIRSSIKRGKMHMSLLDPEKQSPQRAGEIAYEAWKIGTDAIMVGGSTGVTEKNLNETVKEIKGRIKIPVVLFPAGAHALSRYADAVYFMSMLNSRNINNIVGEQRKASRKVKRMGIEPISMGYVIVEPGMKVGEVGEANLVRRSNVLEALEYGLTAQYFGMDLFYLEAGSGSPLPVPERMIRAVKKEIDIPLVVGGGIRSSRDARKVAEAGADIIVTGTIIEESESKSALREIVEAIKGGGSKLKPRQFNRLKRKPLE